MLNDSNGNTITKIEEGHAIKFHNRIIINPNSYIKEGDSIMLLTNENLDNITTYFNDELIRSVKEHLKTNKELLSTRKEFIEYVNNTNTRLKQLEKDNIELKQLNNELNVKIIDLNKD